MTANPTWQGLREELPRDQRQQETARLFTEAHQATGPERDVLLNQVVLVNTGVARSLARRYARRGVPLEDLEQVAYTALVRAAHKFDPTVAADFLTYAVPTIRGEIKRWFRDHGWMVRPPRSLQELQSAAMQVREEASAHGDELRSAQIAAVLGVSEREVDEALSIRGCFTPASLDAPTDAVEEGASLSDLLPTYDDDLAAIEVRLMLEQAVANLTPRERLIVRLRFNEEMSQKEIGEVIGVTQMQVSRLLSKVLRRLRELLQDDPMARGEGWEF
ncbi:RNA polymerase sigma-B factor [Nocardioides terrae]|uniref:RNA polymerase sigma-B factor n=1 Tax=Nocardioides terrae TaxID=574651 RepID=A0A1I1I278_9ACTN|nr:sigma-70 family RNA polymerase sigma factor [Nocardioides terrae]SFC29922.1 RNA polymerase sigma-B factor [Nocardioides terrae]